MDLRVDQSGHQDTHADGRKLDRECPSEANNRAALGRQRRKTRSARLGCGSAAQHCPAIGGTSLKLFDDGHYSQATFEAFKYLDLQVKNLSAVTDGGYKLMMNALSETAPKIKLTPLSSQSEIDEQMGYKHVFAGAISAIRYPRGHEINLDPIDRCLDHLSFASVLLRRLEDHIPK